jgi:methylthioribose-1-phosphate isomerase
LRGDRPPWASADRGDRLAGDRIGQCKFSRIATQVLWQLLNMERQPPPIYLAHEAGIPVHVWVDETRPRNQGAALTAFELSQYGVPHTVIADNAGGLLMQRGDVDVCFVGVDRVTRNGDAINKVGTYLKALAAHDCGVPFYVAMPFTSFDGSTSAGGEVPIEERSADEVTHIQGGDGDRGSDRSCES